MNEKIRCRVTDTKQEILRNYKTHLDEINSRTAQAVPTTIEQAHKMLAKQAIATAATVEASTVEELAVKLNRSISDNLLGISQKITEQKAQFDQIQAAIKAKQDELKEVHSIEIEANTLAAIVAAQNKAKEEANEEIDQILQEAQNQAAEILKVAETSAAAIRAAITQDQQDEVQRRKRGEEEYQYNFNRDKTQRENALKDALALQSRSLDRREASITEREKAQAEKDAYTTKVVAELEALKASVEKMINEAVVKAVKDAERSAAISASIVSSKHASELLLKDSEVKSLTAQVTELRTRVDQSQNALASAQKQVQDVAMEALRAKAEASRPLVVNGNENSGKR
jgi:colicin import membrane protein